MLQLVATDRTAIWTELVRELEEYAASIDSLRVSPTLDPEAVRQLLRPLDFLTPVLPQAAIRFVAEALSKHQVHTGHSRYFGLFNPAPTTMGIVADALVAGFNPQLAAWSHSPFAVEAERHLIQAFGERFGYNRESVDGTFTSGGMEANHTALLTALTNAFPQFATNGLRALPGQPVLYLASESHHSLKKAARLCGLGSQAVRTVPVDSKLAMDPAALAATIKADRSAGLLPFFVGATAGTTNAGVVDPLRKVSRIASDEGLWFHTDAAWGGAAILLPELRYVLDGINESDSLTFDAHKWLSVPMGAGMYLTRHQKVLERTFQVKTAYMPADAEELSIVDPHLHSMQWSRRFIGLKLLLSLAVAGWKGYEEAIRHQTAMGALLREHLEKAGWEIVNDTPLPVVCFVMPNVSSAEQKEIASRVVKSGEAWISTAVVGSGQTVLRACITNFRTSEKDIQALLASLDRARCELAITAPAIRPPIV